MRMFRRKFQVGFTSLAGGHFRLQNGKKLLPRIHTERLQYLSAVTKTLIDRRRSSPGLFGNSPHGQGMLSTSFPQLASSVQNALFKRWISMTRSEEHTSELQ